MKRSTKSRPSVSDVASHAGVSVGTVSNVLNRPERVSPRALSRVEKAIAELGFVPNSSARLLRTGQQPSVGLIVSNISNPYYTEIVRGVEDALLASNMTLTLASSDLDSQREDLLVRMFEQNGVRGLIAFARDGDSAHFSGAHDRGMSIVFVDTGSSSLIFSGVNVDNVSGGNQAMGHLADSSYEKFVFVNGPSSLYQCRDRLTGALQALESRGIEIARDFLEIKTEKMVSEEGEGTLNEIESFAQGKPVGVMCVNDLVALGLLRAIRARGLDMPKRIGVVGYDDLSFSAELFTPLSSVSQPNYRVGYRAAEILIRQLGSEEAVEPENVMFQPKLVVRSSSLGSN